LARQLWVARQGRQELEGVLVNLSFFADVPVARHDPVWIRVARRDPSHRFGPELEIPVAGEANVRRIRCF
jgi:hypothetical protein